MTCRDRLLSGECPIIDPDVLKRAYEVDRNMRAEAQKRGRTQVLVSVPAKRSRWANQFSMGDTDPGDGHDEPTHQVKSKRPVREAVSAAKPASLKRQRRNT